LLKEFLECPTTVPHNKIAEPLSGCTASFLSGDYESRCLSGFLTIALLAIRHGGQVAHDQEGRRSAI